MVCDEAMYYLLVKLNGLKFTTGRIVGYKQEI